MPRILGVSAYYHEGAGTLRVEVHWVFAAASTHGLIGDRPRIELGNAIARRVLGDPGRSDRCAL